jgi:hypothetical protein
MWWHLAVRDVVAPGRLAHTKVGGKSYSDVRKRTFYIKNGNVFVSDGSGWSYDEGVQK